MLFTAKKLRFTFKFPRITDAFSTLERIGQSNSERNELSNDDGVNPVDSILDEAGKKSLNNSPSNIQLEYVLAKERDVDAMKEAIRADKQGKSIEIIHQPIQEKENYFQADEYNIDSKDRLVEDGNYKGIDKTLKENKKGNSIKLNIANDEKTINNELVPYVIKNVKGTSANNWLEDNSEDDDLDGQPSLNKKKITNITPDPSNSINGNRHTTNTRDDELQYITVYYNHDDEEEASEVIHRSLENIINDTNTDLINILQSYGFKGDPYSFEIATEPISIADVDEPDDGTLADIPQNLLDITENNSVDLQARSTNSSIIIQGEVLKVPLNDLLVTRRSIISSDVTLATEKSTILSDVTFPDNYEIFTYNQTKNVLDVYPREKNNRGINDKKQEFKQRPSQSETKFQNRFQPSNFRQIFEEELSGKKVSYFKKECLAGIEQAKCLIAYPETSIFYESFAFLF
jgi:hypothetical protein